VMRNNRSARRRFGKPPAVWITGKRSVESGTVN